MIRTLKLAACSLAIGCGPMPEQQELTDAERFGPTDSCNEYIACAEATAEEDLALLTEVYGPDATCWAEATSALACSETCEAETAAQVLLTPAVPQCWTQGPPPAAALFDELGERWEIASVDECFSGEGATVWFGRNYYSPDVTAFTFEIVGTQFEDFECTPSADGSFTCMSGPSRTAEGSFDLDRPQPRIHITTIRGDGLVDCVATLRPVDKY